MIGNILLLLIQAFIQILIAPLLLFPDVAPLPAITKIIQFVGIIHGIIPLTTVALIGGLITMIGIEVLILGFKATSFLIKKIPTIN